MENKEISIGDSKNKNVQKNPEGLNEHSNASSNFSFSTLELVKFDPIAKIIVSITHNRIYLTPIIALIFNGVVIIGLGMIISSLYSNAGYNFLSLLDTRSLGFIIVGHLVISPIVWTFYIWQLNGAVSIFRKLLIENGVISSPKKETTSPFNTFYEKKLINSYNNKIFTALALTISIIAILLYIVLDINPMNPFLFGFRNTWYQINPIYYWGVFIPHITLNIYLITWVVIRTVILIAFLSSLYKEFTIRPKPFFYDKCNGFSPIGDYALRIALIAIAFGFFVTLATAYPIFFGERLNLKADTILMMFVYILAIPSFLIIPVWSTHLAQIKAKNIVLEDVAVQIRNFLSNEEISELPETMESIEVLEKKYKLLDNQYKTWPFRRPALRRFSITALLPIVTTIVTLLIDIYSK